MNIKLSSIFCATLFALSSNASTSLVEDAKKMFLPEKMNSLSFMMTGEYEDFRKRMNFCVSEGLRQSVEPVIINAITSIVVSVSTNYLDDSVGIDVLNSRTDYFREMDFRGMSLNGCIALANFLNRIQVVSYPSDLVSTRLSVYRYRFETTTNSIGEVKTTVKGYGNEKSIEEQKRQVRIFNANRKVEQFRGMILDKCSKSISERRRTMNDEDFSAFTNQVVRISNMSQDEQKVLFRGINKKLPVKDFEETK